MEPEHNLNGTFTIRSVSPRYARLMQMTSGKLAVVALAIVVVLALAIHLYGRELGRLIHGR